MALIPKSQREQWRAELEAATRGPWEPNVWIETDGNEWRATGPGHDDESSEYDSSPGCPDEQAAQADARLIASAPTAISALLAENDELRRMVREACGIAGVLAIELRACYAELGEEYDMGDDNRIAELAREVGDE